MKKIVTAALLAFTCANMAVAQNDPKARAVLNEVSNKYKTYSNVKTDFTYTLNNPKAGVNETMTGTLYAKAKSAKYKVVLYKKDNGKNAVNQELISDGKTQWTYLKKDNEVQVNEVDNSNEALNPSQLFTIYERGFKYNYNGEQKVGGVAYHVIDLTPTDPKKQIFKVRLMIDKTKKQIYSAQIFDKGGSRYTYTLKTFVPNTAVPETTFAFDAKQYPGVEVVDLR